MIFTLILICISYSSIFLTFQFYEVLWGTASTFHCKSIPITRSGTNVGNTKQQLCFGTMKLYQNWRRIFFPLLNVLFYVVFLFAVTISKVYFWNIYYSLQEFLSFNLLIFLVICVFFFIYLLISFGGGSHPSRTFSDMSFLL